MAITSKDLDPDFKWEVAGRPEAALVQRCFDCGSCVGICPVRERFPDESPAQHRRRLADLVLGPELAATVYGPLLEPD